MRVRKPRETTISVVVPVDDPPPGNVDVCWRLLDGTVVLDGWLDAPPEDLRVSVVDASGREHGHVKPLRKHRSDVCRFLERPMENAYGFLACLPEGLAVAESRMKVEVASSSGVARTFEVAPEMAYGPVGHLLHNCQEPDLDLTEIVKANAVPLIRHDGAVRQEVEADVAFRTASWPGTCLLNVVIPLYSNFHYLRNQLMSLSQARQSIDLVVTLVCDDPSLEAPLLTWLHRSSDVYDIPTQCVAHSVNAGFAQACNTGAAAVEAQYVFLLNSDVLPQGPEDLRNLLEMASQAGTAVVAPVLLYPDGSLQHAGMALQRSSRFDSRLLPIHPGKGLPVEWSAIPERVPLLSGAALLMETADYEAVGGMPLEFGRGDFEDVLFSIRMAQLGALRVDSRVKWIHIEGGSYDRSSSGAVVSVIAKSLVLEDVLPETGVLDLGWS